MNHQAVALDAERVLACGGLVDIQSDARMLDSCEIYSVSTNAWSATAWPALPAARHLFTLTRLDAEHVLAVGGITPGAEPESLAAIPNAVVGTASAWSAPEAIRARWGHATSLLPDGRVLVVGGMDLDGLVPEVELRSTATGAAVWTTVGSHSFSEPSATALQAGPVPNGQAMEVMVLGGMDAQSHAQASARLYSLPAGAPASSGVWRDLSPMPGGRYRHTATLLDNGDVLIVGGLNEADRPIAEAYRYDRREEKWKPAGTPLSRYEHSAARIGRYVVVAGGVVDFSASDTVEAYDPERDPVLHPDTVAAGTNPWIALKPLVKARQDATMTALADGSSALVVGGTDGRVESQTAELLTLGVSATKCTSNAACLSGFCADGVCCNRSCQGACEACDEAGHVGTCSAISGMSHAQHPACPSGSVCSAGECSSDCRKGAPCGDDQSCSATGSCVTLKTPGQSCSADAECRSGLVCADGVCCGSSCAGACESCSEPGQEGTCVPIVGTPREGHPACSSDSCGPRCNGSSGACRAPAQCPPVGCGRDSDCASDRYCSAGTCVPKGDAGNPCQADRECAQSLACVEQVCCRAQSCGPGASCALAPYEGTCKKALGVGCETDFECASDRCEKICCVEGACPGDCTKTSDCEAGYVCDAGHCKEKPVEPPPEPRARCSSDGVTLIGANGTETSCAPYRCAGTPPSCATTCRDSSECVAPTLCDPSQTCREPRPPITQGCSLRPQGSSGHGLGAAWLVGAVLALHGARRARRTRRA